MAATPLSSIVQTESLEENAGSPPPTPKTSRLWWKQSASYVASGISICRQDIPGLVTLVGLFALPPLAAVIVGSQPGALAFWIASALPWITITLGNIAIVLAIEAIDAGQPVIPAQILPATLRWLPRYLWANGITTALFWGIFTPLQWVITQQTDRWGWLSIAPLALLLLPMLFWHVRLVFATYAAIVDDQPGVRSVIISIGIAHRRWLMVAAAFVGSVLVEAPIVGPLYLMVLTITNPLVAGGFTWAIIILMRPIFIATLHEIYQDFRPATAIVASRTKPRPVPIWQFLRMRATLRLVRMRWVLLQQFIVQLIVPWQSGIKWLSYWHLAIRTRLHVALDRVPLLKLRQSLARLSFESARASRHQSLQVTSPRQQFGLARHLSLKIIRPTRLRH